MDPVSQGCGVTYPIAGVPRAAAVDNDNAVLTDFSERRVQRSNAELGIARKSSDRSPGTSAGIADRNLKCGQKTTRTKVT